LLQNSLNSCDTTQLLNNSFTGILIKISFTGTPRLDKFCKDILQKKKKEMDLFDPGYSETEHVSTDAHKRNYVKILLWKLLGKFKKERKMKIDILSRLPTPPNK
jgi:hypothetical protein